MKRYIISLIILITISFNIGFFIGMNLNKDEIIVDKEKIVEEIEIPDLDSVIDDNFTYVEYYM